MHALIHPIRRTGLAIALPVVILVHAASATAAVVDFETVPTATEINGLNVGGITFSDVLLPGTTYPRATVVEDPPNYQYIQDHYLIGGTDAGNLLTMTLDVPATEFSFGFGGSTASFQDVTATATAFDSGGAPLDTIVLTGTDLTADPSQPGSPFLREGFISFAGVGDIASVEVSFAADSRFWKVDAISYTPVPTPGAISIAVLGVSLCARRRR